MSNLVPAARESDFSTGSGCCSEMAHSVDSSSSQGNDHDPELDEHGVPDITMGERKFTDVKKEQTETKATKSKAKQEKDDEDDMKEIKVTKGELKRLRKLLTEGDSAMSRAGNQIVKQKR